MRIRRIGSRAVWTWSVLVAMSLVPGAPVSAESSQDSVSWRADHCQEAALFVRTSWKNVEPHVAPSFRDRIVRLPAAGGELATLMFTLNRCGATRVISQRGEFSTDTASEVIVGALMQPDSEDSQQFYTLASYIDWAPLATAFGEIGVPVAHVPGLIHALALDPMTGRGTIDVQVPAPGDAFAVSGSVVAANPVSVDDRAAQYAVGPQGPVRVEHHSPQFAINPGASATVTAARADGFLAGVMGAQSRQADGFFFDKGPGHDHTATRL